MEEKLRIVQEDSMYDMIIPAEVERKIRLLCKEIHDVEWSGILFYTVEGSFTEKNLVITCKDIYQMDEGDSGYTEYKMSPEVIAYCVDHPELLKAGVYQGNVHSHSVMRAFFSTTDTETLVSEGSDMAHFVSLIVNNAGTYTAAVTRRVRIKTDMKRSISYPTWGNKEITDYETEDKEEEVIQKFDLRIKEEYEDKEVLDRIKEIRNKKKSVKNSPKSPLPPFKEDLFEPVPDDVPDYDFPVDDSTIKGIIQQIIAGSPLARNITDFNMELWLNNIDNIYQKRFPDDTAFEEWAINFLDYILREERGISEYFPNNEFSSILAYKTAGKLREIEGEKPSKFIELYIKLLSDYMI